MDKKEINMDLTQTEANVIKAYREEAAIEVGFYGANLTKKEAFDRVKGFGEVITKMSEDGDTWFSNPADFYGITATAFYNKEKTASE